MCYSGKKAFLPITNHQSLIAVRTRQSGFTLIEVMLAVVILSLVATASLKLVVLAQNSLRAVKENREFLVAAEKLRTEILTGEVTGSGNDKNLSWKTETGEKKFFTADFGKIDFNDKNKEVAMDNSFRWRELEIIDSVKNKKIKIVLPIAKGE